MQTPGRIQGYMRVLTVGLAAIATMALLVWRRGSDAPLLGIPERIESTVLSLAVGMAWAFLLWALGLIRASHPPRFVDKTLDNLAWHLDSVRAANLPDDRAANVGGPFLTWLVTRGHLRTQNLVGMDESIDAFRLGNSSVAELYEDLGEKLTTSLVLQPLVGFSERYLDARSGRYFADLEEVLGTDPYDVEVTPKHLRELYDLIDARLRDGEKSR